MILETRKGEEDMEMYFCPLYSGSSGNSTLIEYGDTKILIDAGKNNKCLTNALNKVGVGANEINAVFVTHEHTDHISALIAAN